MDSWSLVNPLMASWNCIKFVKDLLSSSRSKRYKCILVISRVQIWPSSYCVFKDTQYSIWVSKKKRKRLPKHNMMKKATTSWAKVRLVIWLPPNPFQDSDMFLRKTQTFHWSPNIPEILEDRVAISGRQNKSMLTSPKILGVVLAWNVLPVSEKVMTFVVGGSDETITQRH